MDIKIGILILMIFFVIVILVMKIENMEEEPPSLLEHHLEKIKEKKRKNLKTYAISMRDGILRGSLGGMLTGNWEGMLGSAVSYGLLNPLFKYFETS